MEGLEGGPSQTSRTESLSLEGGGGDGGPSRGEEEEEEEDEEDDEEESDCERGLARPPLFLRTSSPVILVNPFPSSHSTSYFSSFPSPSGTTPTTVPVKGVGLWEGTGEGGREGGRRG